MNKALIEKIATCANAATNCTNMASDSTQIVKEIFDKTDTVTFKGVSAFEAGRLFERIDKHMENSNQDSPIYEVDTEKILKKLEEVEGEIQKDDILFDEIVPYVEQAFIFGYLKALEDNF